jgi:predicted transcriptional regulator
LDAVYCIITNCVGEGQPVNHLMYMTSISYKTLLPLVKELVQRKLLEDLIADRPQDRYYRWGNLYPRPSREAVKIPGKKSRDGLNHRYKTTSKGIKYIELFDELADMVSPETIQKVIR